MSYETHMKGYLDPRTLYQVDSLYAWRHGRYFPPVLVEISPSNGCNQKCLYCYTYDRRKDASRLRDDTFVALLPQLADAGVKAILLQGTGEPLLHRAVPAAVKAGAERNLPIGVNTNGVLLTPAFQDRALQHLFYVKFSVLESDPERYAYAHGCPQTQWQQLMTNIDYAVTLRQKDGLGVALWATVYLDERNFREARNIVSFFKNKGLDYIVIQEATYGTYAPRGNREYASRCFSPDEIADMTAGVMSLNDRHFAVKVRFPLIDDDVNYSGMTKETFKPNFCHGTKFYCLIDANGEVYPCWRAWGSGNALSFGNIHEKSFEKIWKGRKRKRIEEFINTVPPSASECVVCNHARLNEILHKSLHAESQWKNFII